MKRKLLTEIDREMVISQIKRLDLKDRYTVDITKRVIRRTISQNNLMWLWLTCIQYETGQDKDELHEIFKKKWIPPKTIFKYGVEVEIYSTKDFDTSQFKYYLDKIQIFASTELSITLPDPEDKRWEDFYDYYKDKI